MKTLRRLMLEAKQSTTSNGHKLGAFKALSYSKNSMRVALCISCGKGIEIDTDPNPFHAAISGSALISNCK